MKTAPDGKYENKRRLSKVSYLKAGIPFSEMAKEILRVVQDYRKKSEIIEVTDQYFKYRPRTKMVVISVAKNDEGKLSAEFGEIALAKDEGPIKEMGYTEEGLVYETDGSYAEYRDSIDPSEYAEEHFKSSEALEEKADVSGDIHDKLVLWFYNWLTIDILFMHSFDIEFGGSAGFNFLTKDPNLILPLTKEAITSRAVRGDPRIELEKVFDNQLHELYLEISGIDKKKGDEVIKLARNETVKIRFDELQ